MNRKISYYWIRCIFYIIITKYSTETADKMYQILPERSKLSYIEDAWMLTNFQIGEYPFSVADLHQYQLFYTGEAGVILSGGSGGGLHYVNNGATYTLNLLAGEGVTKGLWHHIGFGYTNSKLFLELDFNYYILDTNTHQIDV